MQTKPATEKENAEYGCIPTNKRLYWFFKRIFDIVMSFLALVFLSPVMLIIITMIIIDDHKAGPIYKQKRCGRKGREFTFYKFRTMVHNADELLEGLLHKNEMDGPVFKIKNDPRITRVGKFLRQTSLDELPQFFNVLMGDMSIVGPRPPVPREVATYNDYQWQRLAISPGLTCYWQTTPKRNELSFDEWVELDIKYIRERNFWVDIKIIFKTVGVVFSAQGE